MLAVVGLTAVLCGWFVAARKRADVQDALIAAVAGKRATLWADRLGPKWLDVVGTERFRRYIVGVSFESGADKLERDGAFVRLEQLSDLRYFNLVAERLTPGMADALRGTRRLRMLSINASSLSFRKYNDEPVLQDCFASIGQMTKLEHLYLDADDRAITSECLAGWARLANLKSLALNAVFVNEPPLLKHLPALPQVEFVDLSDSEIGDEDLRFLAALPALKSLILADTDVTGAGLEKLASFEFLEELTIGADAVSPAGLESLLPVKRLRKLHIDGVPYRREYADPAMFAELAIDDEDVVLVAEGNLAGCQRALEALRHSKPSIVIDHVWDTCGQSRERMLRMIPPYSEHESSRSALELMVHQWLQQSKAPN